MRRAKRPDKKRARNVAGSAMSFTDSRPGDRGQAEFASCWQRDKVTVDGGSQTHEITTDEMATQAVDRVEVEVQTDEVVVKASVLSYAGAVTGLSPQAIDGTCAAWRLWTRVNPCRSVFLLWDCRTRLCGLLLTQPTPSIPSTRGQPSTASYGTPNHWWCRL